MFLDHHHAQLWHSELARLEADDHHAVIGCLYASLFILTGMDAYDRIKDRIHATWLDIQDILDNVRLSTGEQMLVKLAGHLYNGYGAVSLYDLFTYCDADCRSLVVSAVEMRNMTGVPLEEIRAVWNKHFFRPDPTPEQ